MEELVEEYIVKTGYIKGNSYFKEMYLKDIENKWNIDLSKMSGNKVSIKRFDYVIKTENQIYVIETNFYVSDGSNLMKLQEVIKCYPMKLIK